VTGAPPTAHSDSTACFRASHEREVALDAYPPNTMGSFAYWLAKEASASGPPRLVLVAREIQEGGSVRFGMRELGTEWVRWATERYSAWDETAATIVGDASRQLLAAQAVAVTRLCQLHQTQWSCVADAYSMAARQHFVLPEEDQLTDLQSMVEPASLARSFYLVVEALSRRTRPLTTAWPTPNIAPEAEALLTRENLAPALQRLLRAAWGCVRFAEASVSLTRYDDMSDLDLVRVELTTVLTGIPAVRAEDDILAGLSDETGDELANRFMVVVR